MEGAHARSVSPRGEQSCWEVLCNGELWFSFCLPCSLLFLQKTQIN